MVEGEDQEESGEMLPGDRLHCLVRNFILKQANDHHTFDQVNQRVALPVLVQTWKGNPRSEVHLHCLCNYELTEGERNEFHLQNALALEIHK